MRKYISDIIKTRDIDKWKYGNRILITAQTGTGKSEFVRTKLYEYAKANNRKILWLTNRDILKNQVLEALDEERLKTITVKNYQKLENDLSDNTWNLFSLISKYDYIIYDEVHSLFEDASFSRQTDLMLEPLKSDTNLDKIFIFLTATPQQLYLFLDKSKFDYLYSMPASYSYIEKLYFYNKDRTFENIINRIPSNEKIIYFANNIEDAKRTASNYSNAKFICSDHNDKYRLYISKSTVKEIVEEEKFSCHLLCTTKVMDNGINIKDKAVKHIILDIFSAVELIQCLGRKRILDADDKVKVYILLRRKDEIEFHLNKVKSPLASVELLEENGISEFQRVNKRNTFDPIIHNDFTINHSRKIYFEYAKKMYEEMLQKGFHDYILELLGVQQWNTGNADKHFESIALSEILDQYVGKKLFGDDKENFKDLFLNAVFSPKRKDRKIGIHTINGIIQDDEIPYEITADQENSRKTKRGNRFWIISKTT